MKTCAWLAAGGILLFAVSGHPDFLNLRIVGLILILRGAAGFWLGIGRDRRAGYSEQFRRAVVRSADAFEAFTADLARDDNCSVSLDELLAHSRRRDRN
jgi:hypothetical protein